MTMGIVVVACLAATAAGHEVVTIRSTCRRTSSAARACDTRWEANAVMAEKVREARQPTRPVVDPNIAVNDYAKRWLDQIASTVKPKTQKSYSLALRLHILPAPGATKVRMLQKGRIKSFLVERLRQGKVRVLIEGGVATEMREPLARDSVRIIHATLRPC